MASTFVKAEEASRSHGLDPADAIVLASVLLDPELGMVYWAYGNVRSCRSSQDGELRPGDNLFSDSMVALDDKTGEYRWHFQTNHHDIWDMDNTHPPVLADVLIDGVMRKVLYQGSKSGMTFVLQ